MKKPTTKRQICRNCGARFTELYCPDCGQRNDVARLRLASLAESFISTFLGDGAIGEKRSNIRYGFLLTLWSIATRPGLTVAEYLEGRRRKYFNPVTILLLLSGFYALAATFTSTADDTFKSTGSWWSDYFNIFMAYCNSHPAMRHLLLLPFTALSYKWLFRKFSDLHYVEYLYIGIFGAIFAVTLLIIRLPFESIPAIATIDNYVMALCMAAQCWFAIQIFRSLFTISRKRAFWNWIASIGLSYTLCFFALVALAALILCGFYLISPEQFGGVIERAANIMESAEAVDSLQMK